MASIFNTSRTIQIISASVNPTDVESRVEGVLWLLRVVDWDVSLRVVAAAGCHRFLFVGGWEVTAWFDTEAHRFPRFDSLLSNKTVSCLVPARGCRPHGAELADLSRVDAFLHPRFIPEFVKPFGLGRALHDFFYTWVQFEVLLVDGATTFCTMSNKFACLMCSSVMYQQSTTTVISFLFTVI